MSDHSPSVVASVAVPLLLSELLHTHTHTHPLIAMLHEKKAR